MLVPLEALLVEHDIDLDTLPELTDQDLAQSGEGQFVLLAGEAGIGNPASSRYCASAGAPLRMFSVCNARCITPTPRSIR